MPRNRRRGIVLATIAAVLAWIMVAGSIGAQAQETTAPPAKPKASPRPRSKPAHVARGFRMYMGRPIAEVMSYQGAEWLIRPERVQEEQPEAMLEALKIAPGASVADVGAGVGYNSLKMAQRVGPSGKVYATDIQPQMLRMLADNAREAGVENIKLIRSAADDPRLPENQIDLALMVDVYHECSDPEATLRGLRKALKPGGRLVLVEYRGEDPEVPIKPEHKMTLRQVRRELEPQGFVFKESLEFLPWQHIIIFERGKDELKNKDETTKSAAVAPAS